MPNEELKIAEILENFDSGSLDSWRALANYADPFFTAGSFLFTIGKHFLVDEPARREQERFFELFRAEILNEIRLARDTVLNQLAGDRIQEITAGVLGIRDSVDDIETFQSEVIFGNLRTRSNELKNAITQVLDNPETDDGAFHVYYGLLSILIPQRIAAVNLFNEIVEEDRRLSDAELADVTSRDSEELDSYQVRGIASAKRVGRNRVSRINTRIEELDIERPPGSPPVLSIEKFFETDDGRRTIVFNPTPNDEQRLTRDHQTARRLKANETSSPLEGVLASNLGIGGPGGGPFRDSPTGRFERIVIRSGAIIDSIQSFWVGGSSNRHGGGGGGQHEIRFDADEFITRIDGSTGLFENFFLISSLTIHTNKRSHGPFGNVNVDSEFTFAAPTGFRISGFLGASGVFLDKIGMVVDET